MIYAEVQNNSNNYNLFNFQMAIIIAHEMVHLLTVYPTGKKLPLTPQVFPWPYMGT
jgi:hypothetical protein